MIQQETKSSIMMQVATYLEMANGFMVPTKTLWKQFLEDATSENISYDAFVEMLRNDARFCVFDTDETVMTELSNLVSKNEMEELGYYEGPRVMLKKRVPDEADVVDMLLEKADQTFESLKQAWALRPEDDPATEDRLLKALAKAQRLQRELRALFARESLNNKEEQSSS